MVRAAGGAEPSVNTFHWSEQTLLTPPPSLADKQIDNTDNILQHIYQPCARTIITFTYPCVLGTLSLGTVHSLAIMGWAFTHHQQLKHGWESLWDKSGEKYHQLQLCFSNCLYRGSVDTLLFQRQTTKLTSAQQTYQPVRILGVRGHIFNFDGYLANRKNYFIFLLLFCRPPDSYLGLQTEIKINTFYFLKAKKYLLCIGSLLSNGTLQCSKFSEGTKAPSVVVWAQQSVCAF